MAKKNKPIANKTGSAGNPRPTTSPAQTNVTPPVSVSKRTEPPAPKPKSEPTPPPSLRNDGRPLVVFDRKMKIFLYTCAALYAFMIMAKLNGSSVGVWDQIIPSGNVANRTVISGQPRMIRMDEWAILTPFMTSQAAKGFPIKNFTNGGENGSLMGLPVKHPIALIKPNLWGFFIFDFERGYSYWWGFKIFGMLISVMMFLMVLTNSNFWLSLFGSIWVLLSSGTQWWFSVTVPDMFTSGCLLFTATCYYLYSTQTRTIIISALVATLGLLWFAILLYPPYEVPLGYFLLICLAGFIVRNPDWNRMKSGLNMKLVSAGIAILVMGILGYLVYNDLKDTIKVLANTVYPGKRSELGGTGFVGNWFSEFYYTWVMEKQLPPKWLNICEFSHYMNFVPVLVLGSVATFVKNRKIDVMMLGLSILSIVLLLWILVGFPEFLAKLTLLNTSPTRRTQVPFGFASVLFAVLYIDYASKSSQLDNRLVTIGLVIVLAIASYFISGTMQTDSGNLFTTNQLIISSLLFIILNGLLLFSFSWRYRFLAFGIIVTLYYLPNLKVNPVNKGLTAMTENTLFSTVKTMGEAEPNAKWVVMGDRFLSYLISGTGVDLLSGVKFIPDFKTMRTLDPTAKRDSAYNRYAHTVYYSYINGRDTVVFNSTFEDGYTVGMDACSPKLKALNVKYFVFDREPQAVEVRCLKLMQTLGNIRIYRAND
ncbi:hypothetical protein GCM10027592_45120 [Spirosoma flavus]